MAKDKKSTIADPVTPEVRYNKEYFEKADGHVSWKNGNLKFGDSLAALSYAHGITWNQLVKFWPSIFDVNPYGRAEYSSRQIIYHQITYLRRFTQRMPKNILEIGGGRGEVANTIKFMGVNVVSVEPGKDAVDTYHETGKRFFGETHTPVVPVNKTVTQAIADNDLDLSKFDTIMMIESLEHIPEDEFEVFWTKIKQEFQGRFIAVNWMDYHPIWVGRDASPEEHCRLVDDHLYDRLTSEANKFVYRNGSHLVLDF